MDSKEKAKELVDHFIQRTRNNNEPSMSYNRAVKSALICVNEMKLASKRITNHLPSSWCGEEQKYYNEIKKELIKK